MHWWKEKRTLGGFKVSRERHLDSTYGCVIVDDDKNAFEPEMLGPNAKSHHLVVNSINISRLTASMRGPCLKSSCLQSVLYCVLVELPYEN